MAAPGTVTHVMEVAAVLRAAADAHAATLAEAAAVPVPTAPRDVPAPPPA